MSSTHSDTFTATPRSLLLHQVCGGTFTVESLAAKAIGSRRRGGEVWRTKSPGGGFLVGFLVPKNPPKSIGNMLFGGFLGTFKNGR